MAAIIAAHHEAEEQHRREAADRAYAEAHGEHYEPPDHHAEPGASQLKRDNTMNHLAQIVPAPMLPGQMKVLEMYHGEVCQLGVALLIVLNFIISAIEAQIIVTEADAAKHKTVFSYFEWTFNILFGIELIVNLYAHWFCPFWKSSWNVFDVVIVGISWVSMLAGGKGALSVLRLFRAFRAFRLFKRIESVRIIIVGVATSLPGVSNAFVLLIIIMGIWAIMGVSFFRHDFDDLFGNFTKAMLTLFQVMTFDSWVSGVTRPVCLYYNSWGTPFYFISYMFVSGIIMTNVVVAILLEKFMEASEALEAEKAARKAMEQGLLQDESNQKDKVEQEDYGKGNDDQVEAHKDVDDDVKKAHKTWVQLKEHFCFRVGQMETKCKKPLPETKKEEQDRLAKEQAKEEEDRLERRRNDILFGQSYLKECYESPIPQLVVAGAICMNFLVSATKAEMLPAEDSGAMVVFDVFEWFFNLLFGFELIVNMYSNFCIPFWKDPWNIFDFFIVLISWLSMMDLLQGGISVLRLFRAFRVFRLFKRVKSLRQIIAGIGKSLPGVSNAFIILTLVMGIWSIMGKNFFGGEFPNEFGNFFKAMLTMFQVMSYDSWSSGITRPVVFKYMDTGIWFIAPIFFVTYVFISAIIMSNVVLAILLDKFLAAAAEFEQQEKEANGIDDGSNLGILSFDDVMGQVDNGMCLEIEHLREFEAKMQEKLNELHAIVQGPLRTFVVSQKSKAYENGAAPKRTLCCPIGGSSGKSARVAPA